ncbi:MULTISPECIES: winged helix-turn-helix domain-containing protein [Bacillus cereus group]|uniref:winged helix-turn-helix domain-containing protein n=1 Tax=Bacillus cereus group TaxID=86661 RepID=UPI0009B70A06|nr:MULTISPECIES: winged helix-turn-helix domain-containing protein [Bacillus cereus group]ARC28597.1 winged helix-turn-helix domain-containing protein [Bacillus sp. FDAARGOS_235]PEI60247.1 winged helix-turn-helix domain-containing protein [Bacillus toyonensis]
MDNTWDKYLEWRNEKGYIGLSTEGQYNKFLSQVGEEPENENLNRKELHETEELFSDLTVKDKVAETFEAIRSLVTVGTTITYDDLAQLTGLSLRTVKRHVEELQEKGYLHITRGIHANTYYYGVDMRDTTEKKSIHFVDTFEWGNGTEDVAGEVTIKDDIGEIHVTMYNIEGILERTSQFMREKGCLYQHGNDVKKVS